MRPEAGGNAWDSYGSDIPEDFEPYRPGDPSSLDHGVPIEQARGYDDARRLLDELPDRIGRQSPTSRDGRQDDQQPRERFRWSEDSRRYGRGDRVRATGALGDGIMRTVPGGTRGEVVERREGLLGGERLTVEFDNGYRLENVQSSDLERRGWLD